MVAMDGPVAKMQPVAPGDAGIAPAADEPMDTMLADTAPASEPQTEHAPAADIPPIDTAPVPATDTAPRPQAGGGAPTAPASEPRTEPVPVQDMETVANSVRNSLSSTASSQPAVSESASLPRASSADKSAEDPFSLSDIFPSQPAAGGTASIMADSVQSSPVLAPDPSNYVVEASTGAVAALSSLPKSVYSYFSDIAQVAVPRSLSPSFSSSSRLSLRFMTAVDDAPYGLSYSIDTVGGSIFAVKNDIVWPVATAASGAVSDERIIAATDAVIRPIRAGVIRFGSGEIIPDTAGMDTVTVRYPVVAEGVGVYEAYGMPREATVSYDRSAARVSGFSLPHVTGFSRTADTFSSPDETSMEKYVRHELAGRGYVAGRYRIESARYALAPETKPNPGTDAGKETLVPSILLEVTSDAGIRDMFVMPFGR